ncbi:MAG: carotenoid biosynthesis protein, partial [Terriglobales bacterium]
MLRPYVFLFLAVFLFAAQRLIGWRRTGLFFLITWLTAFACEFSSTRTGIPFGWYHYTGSTVGQELYISNVPFMDS